jgi:hypothetical protein
VERTGLDRTARRVAKAALDRENPVVFRPGRATSPRQLTLHAMSIRTERGGREHERESWVVRRLPITASALRLPIGERGDINSQMSP